jgi:hypothetical protein
MCVTVDGSWIDDRSYWILWYSVWPQFTVHYYTHTGVHSHVFISRCSVAVSNGERSSSSGFLNYPRPPLPGSQSNSSQWLNLSSPLTNSPTNYSSLHSTELNWTHLNSTAFTSLTILLITFRDGSHGKHRSYVDVYGPLPSNGLCLFVCFAVDA